MAETNGQVDLLVIGGGMAGLSAAARAAKDGASVALVEKGSTLGGSANYAEFIWTAPTLEVMREVNPNADEALSRRLVENYRAGPRLGPLARRPRRRPSHGHRVRARGSDRHRELLLEVRALDPRSR